MILVELRKLFRRPRTWVTIGLLNLLPLIVAVLLVVTHLAPRPGQGPLFLSTVLTNGTLFPLAALAIVLPLFLPIAVAVVAADSVAGEAQTGTLRYLLWVAALLTPRPPALMVLNEPETSLHPDLLPALARLIARAADAAQVWVVSHSTRLVAALEREGEALYGDCRRLELVKEHGETRLAGQGMLDAPPWRWID